MAVAFPLTGASVVGCVLCGRRGVCFLHRCHRLTQLKIMPVLSVQNALNPWLGRSRRIRCSRRRVFDFLCNHRRQIIASALRSSFPRKVRSTRACLWRRPVPRRCRALCVVHRCCRVPSVFPRFMAGCNSLTAIHPGWRRPRSRSVSAYEVRQCDRPPQFPIARHTSPFWQGHGGQW